MNKIKERANTPGAHPIHGWIITAIEQHVGSPATARYHRVNTKLFTILPLLVCLLLAVSFFTGCGSNGDAMDDWTTTSTVVLTQNIEGQVAAPVTGSQNILSRLTAVGGVQSGATVFVEEKPGYYTTTDNSGKFLLKSVPVGKYHVIAEIVSGSTTYRQRSDLVTLTGQYATFLMQTPIQLIAAPRRLNLVVKDQKTYNAIFGASLTMWGRTVQTTASGEVELGPIPTGVWPVAVKATGYYDANLLLTFDDKRQSLVEFYLTPLTAVDKNQSPTVEMLKDFGNVKTYQTGGLSGLAFDADGDSVILEWKCTSGSFSNNKGLSTVYTAPGQAGTYTIQLTGVDGKGAFGCCYMPIEVIQGSGLTPNPTNRAPIAASDPFPITGALNMGNDIVLKWTGSDPDGDALKYDVYLGPRGSALPMVASGISNAFYHVTNLSPYTMYYWQVISQDPYDAISQNNPTWEFTTGDGNNQPPFKTHDPTPQDFATDQLPSLLLTWIGGDPDGNDGVKYEVSIGSDPEILYIATQTANTRYFMNGLELGKRYYWRVTAADGRGGATIGDRWQFDTYSPLNNPPYDPVAIDPASGTDNVTLNPQFRWRIEDSDSDTLTSDFYIGTSTPLLKMAQNLSSPVYTSSTPLKPLTRYYWQVVVKDSHGAVNTNPTIWSFVTTAQTNHAPNVPTALSPLDKAVEVATQPVLSWSSGDSDGDAVYYKVYLDTASPPQTLVADNVTTQQWSVSAALSAGQVYCWKIIARDQPGLESESAVFRFTTQTNTDAVPPKLVSIAPQTGATGVERSTAIVITFSEPMNKVSVENNFSLTPSVSGSLTWENPSTVVFWPNQPWASGSLQIGVLAAGTARDLAGNILTAEVKTTFCIASDLPIPSGYKSPGLSLYAAIGASVTVPVPGLANGRTVWAVATADNATSVFQVNPNRIVSDVDLANFRTSPEAAFREFARNLSGKPLPKVLAQKKISDILPETVVGQTNQFYIPSNGGVATGTGFPANKITARCLGATDQVYVYVDTAITSPDYSLIAEIRKRFEEGIAPTVRDAFGQEPGSGPDGDSKLTILLTDGMSSGIIGLFNEADLYGNSFADVALRESNERKIIYMVYSLSNAVTRYGVMAHEFQHMVNFWQKRTNGGANTYEETWLNEGMSKLAEEICGYGVIQGDTNTAEILRLMEGDLQNLSLTKWTGLTNYGLSYLFVRFLSEENRYGTTMREITRALTRGALTGKDNVRAVTREIFSRTVGRFYLGMLMNRFSSTTPGDYGFKDLSLSANYSGIVLPGVTVQTIPDAGLAGLSIPADGCRFLKRVSNGNAVNIKFSGFTNPTHLWLYDER